MTTISRPAGGPARGPGRARAHRGRVRAGERRRRHPAPRDEPGRHRAPARPERDRGDPARGGPQPARAAAGDHGYPGRRIPLRPGQRRAVQLARAVLRQPGRRRGRLAARRAAAPRGGPGRLPAAPARRPDRPDRGVRRPRGRAGRAEPRARRNPDGRPDLPAARAAVHVRPLPAVFRLPGAARRAAAQRGAGVDRRQPGRGRLRERQPAAVRPGAGRLPARLPQRRRAHQGRDVAGRRAVRHGWRGGRADGHPVQAGRGPGDLGQPGVRLRDAGRRLQPGQRADAAEAEPVRAVHPPRHRRIPDWPAVRAARGGQDPVRAQRQPDLRLRRGAPGARPRAARHPAEHRRGPHAPGERRTDACRARLRLLASHGPGRIHHAELRHRLPQRLPGGRARGQAGQRRGASRRRHRRGHARRRGRRGHRASARPGLPRPVRGPGPVADRGQPDRARRCRAR